MNQQIKYVFFFLSLCLSYKIEWIEENQKRKRESSETWSRIGNISLTGELGGRKAGEGGPAQTFVTCMARRVEPRVSDC